ncbi:MAG: hypothetical protein Kow0020_11830 [Wenzhouxiangellaceae bacterium]
MNATDFRSIYTVLGPGLTALLGLLCIVLLLRLAGLLFDGVAVHYDPWPVDLPESRGVPGGAVDWALFGRVREQAPEIAEMLPATPLRLRLRGVVSGPQGYAIIVDEQGDEGVYKLGDRIQDEAEVVSIEARRVVLERDGRREALELPGGASGQARAQVPDRPIEGAQTASAPAGIGSLAGLTRQFSLDPEALANQITILPVAGGEFRIRAGRHVALFEQLGFQANDIVLAINGEPVDNQADVRAIFERWDPAQPLAITIRRGDRQLVLTPGR